MKRVHIPFVAVLTFLVVAACGPTDVVVTAEVDRMDPETGEQVLRPITNTRIQMLPFDRDIVFDSLTAEAASPEPQLPAELAVARDSILEAQREWREAESEWLALRESLEEISREMELYNPAEARYQQLFTQFNENETRYFDAEQRKDDAFDRYDRLQQETFQEMDEFRARLMAWEDDAFADYGTAVDERLRATGRDILVDTTDASGVARFGAAQGDWWVYSRYSLATEEFYWNVPVQVEGEGPVEVRLNRENAEIRPIF